MRCKIIPIVLCLGLLTGTGCGPSAGTPDAGIGDPGDASTDPCTGSETRCQGNTFQMCVDGIFENQEHCAAICHAGLGCVQCNPDYGNTCVGDEVHSCESNGTIGGLITTCPPGTCTGGACVDECAEAAATDSYIGCEYWPVDLHNAIEVTGEPIELIPGLPASCLQTGTVVEDHDVCYDAAAITTVAGTCDNGDCSAAGGSYVCTNRSVCVLNAEESPFAIVVSNPHAATVPVTIANSSGTTQTVNVSANSVTQIKPQDIGFADQSVPGTGIGKHAYKVTSTRPVVAYQFNPLDNVGVFSNDGSLLLPAHTYDVKYYAVTTPTLTRRPTTNDYNGYVTIVASAAGTTELDVTASCATLAGGTVPAIAAGGTQHFSLDQWDTLTIEAAADGDLTGTKIVSSNDTSFAVFVGHEAMAMSVGESLCCADHLEDQAFPASTWGVLYAIARSETRDTNPPDRLRIIAQREGTTTAVTFSPAPSVLQGNCGALGAGEFCEVEIAVDTEISATEPIMIGHMLLGTDGDGDPALAFAVPTEQFRNNYNLLVPAEYAENFFAIAAPIDSVVTLDGNDVSASLTTFGTNAYRAGRFPVTAGPHTLACSNGCGVEVMGYDEAVSYLFAGGLDLESIVVD